MTAIRRRSLRAAVGAPATLASADDLDGTTDNTQILDLTGAAGAIIVQHNNGTLGTAGIDLIEVSYDGGISYQADPYLMAIASNPFTGTVLAGILNAAGVEPVNVALFKTGPFHGPAQIRCGRKTTTTGGTTWVTGAPTVTAFRIG